LTSQEETMIPDTGASGCENDLLHTETSQLGYLLRHHLIGASNVCLSDLNVTTGPCDPQLCEKCSEKIWSVDLVDR